MLAIAKPGSSHDDGAKTIVLANQRGSVWHSEEGGLQVFDENTAEHNNRE